MLPSAYNFKKQELVINLTKDGKDSHRGNENITETNSRGICHFHGLKDSTI